MGLEAVILDFDGTLTDVDKEASPAVKSWAEDVGKYLGFGSDDLKRRWANAEDKIKSDLAHYGWLRNGKIIAPAGADPFVLATVTTQVLFDEEKILLDNSKREVVLQEIFRNNYKKAITAFKDNADSFLTKLKEKFSVYIVTNSDTANVAKKLEQLPTNHKDIPLYGNARKYDLDLNWEEVPESVEREGFGRPLFLRRRQYWNVLQKIMQEKRISPENVVSIGDIYELDLLLPEYLSAKTILTPRESTLDCELKAVKAYKKGSIAKNLEEVFDYL